MADGICETVRTPPTPVPISFIDCGFKHVVKELLVIYHQNRFMPFKTTPVLHKILAISLSNKMNFVTQTESFSWSLECPESLQTEPRNQLGALK